MTPDLAFSICNLGVMPAWLLLVVAPSWIYTQRLVHAVWIPLLLGAVYIMAFALNPDTPEGGGFSSLDGVMQLFTSPLAVLAGWVHYLAFDLFVGAWEVRDARRRGVFVWYLATAPTEALTTIPEHRLREETVPRRLGAIGLDTALTHSFNHRRRGRMAFYAADKGEDALLHWYRSRRMLVYPDDRPLPFDVRRIVRPSDGRYCYYTIPNAIAASRDLNDLR